MPHRPQFLNRDPDHCALHASGFPAPCIAHVNRDPGSSARSARLRFPLALPRGPMFRITPLGPPEGCLCFVARNPPEPAA
jgi:hypothetical protein